MTSPLTAYRRTLVRAAGHTAWAVPVVSMATAAPAHAATSAAGGDPVSVDAEFYVHDWGDGTFGFVPRITVSNVGTSQLRFSDLALRFPSDDFVGSRTENDPPLPSEEHFAGIERGGWTYAWQDSFGESDLQLDIYSDPDHDPLPLIGPGQSLTVGTFADPAHPVSLDWVREPAASSVWLAVGYLVPADVGWGYDVVVASLERVEPPGP